MKKFFIAAFVLLASMAVIAQKDSSAAKSKKKDWSKVKLTNRPNDHFMAQIGYDNWAGKPDTIRTVGLSRSFNFYFMLDFPFKSDPRFSVGGGLGIGSSNIFFDKEQVLVADQSNATLAFRDVSGGDHFKKFKLVTTYLEIPLELRFAENPENTNKSWKFAIGAKVGDMLSAYTKGKNKLNNVGQTINPSVEKESSKKYFNSIRLVTTARISYGVFGIFGQYQVTSLIKNGVGPPIYPFSIGICFSGL
jgi:hypothetical protein